MSFKRRPYKVGEYEWVGKDGKVVKKWGKYPEVVILRLGEEMKKEVEFHAHVRGESISDYVRWCIGVGNEKEGEREGTPEEEMRAAYWYKRHGHGGGVKVVEGEE